jgi:hypothetical protein
LATGSHKGAMVSGLALIIASAFKLIALTGGAKTGYNLLKKQRNNLHRLIQTRASSFDEDLLGCLEEAACRKRKTTAYPLLCFSGDEARLMRIALIASTTDQQQCIGW